MDRSGGAFSDLAMVGHGDPQAIQGEHLVAAAVAQRHELDPGRVGGVSDLIDEGASLHQGKCSS